MGKDEVERDRSLQNQIPAPRARVIEAQVPKGRRSRYAAKIGKPAALANTGKNANYGMPLVETSGSGPEISKDFNLD